MMDRVCVYLSELMTQTFGWTWSTSSVCALALGIGANTAILIALMMTGGSLPYALFPDHNNVKAVG
jgi:hypothetical protein